jgi:hypothetical protein
MIGWNPASNSEAEEERFARGRYLGGSVVITLRCTGPSEHWKCRVHQITGKPAMCSHMMLGRGA